GVSRRQLATGGPGRARLTSVVSPGEPPGQLRSRGRVSPGAAAGSAPEPRPGQLHGNGELLTGCRSPVLYRPNLNGARSACCSPSSSFATRAPTPIILNP